MTRLRKKTARVFDQVPTSSFTANVINYSLFVLIMLNIIAIVIGSVDWIRKPYKDYFYWFEVFSVAIFTLEYLARVWSCVDALNATTRHTDTKERLRYMFSPMALIDLCAILPFYLSMFISIDLRFLRVLRMLRIFKLTRYSAAMKTLMSVITDEMPVLVASYVVMITTIFLASSGIYLLEHDIQPEAFGNIPAAMWWAVTTLTTVGYGDVTPHTPLGRLFGAFIMFVGIAMVALPTGILASGFAKTFRRKRQRYELKVSQAFSDGVLTRDEKKKLIGMQESLGISSEDAKQIYKQVLQRNVKHNLDTNKCPHCGENIN